MIRILIILSLSACCGVSSCAQMLFTPGYFVTQAGDTVRGEIKEKDNTTILFRIGSEVDEQKYTPEQVLAFGTNDTGDAVGRSVTWSAGGKTRHVFMREIVSGHASLFELIKPEERLSHAIRLPDQTFVPLPKSMVLLLLTQLLNGCEAPQFRSLMNPQSFYNNGASLERIVTAYNRCVNPGKSIVRLKKVFHYEAGVLAGAALNSWYYGANQVRLSPYWNPNGAFPSAYTGVFGGFITIVPHKRLSLTAEVFYTSYKGERTVNVNNPLDPTDPSARQYSFQERYLSFPITGRYVFSTHPIRWYAKGGICVSYALHIDGKYVLNGTRPVDVPIRPGIGVGYLVGLGAEVPIDKKRKLFVELRTTSHLVLDGVTRMANSRSLQLTIGIPLITR